MALGGSNEGLYPIEYAFPTRAFESVSTDFDLRSHGIDPVAGRVGFTRFNETDSLSGIDQGPPRNQLTWLHKAKTC